MSKNRPIYGQKSSRGASTLNCLWIIWAASKEKAPISSLRTGPCKNYKKKYMSSNSYSLRSKKRCNSYGLPETVGRVKFSRLLTKKSLLT